MNIYIHMCIYSIYIYTCIHILKDFINVYIYIYKWHVCLGSYSLEQSVGRDIRKKVRGGAQGGRHGIRYYIVS